MQYLLVFLCVVLVAAIVFTGAEAYNSKGKNRTYYVISCIFAILCLVASVYRYFQMKHSHSYYGKEFASDDFRNSMGDTVLAALQ